jgi:hypothetical protein
MPGIGEIHFLDTPFLGLDAEFGFRTIQSATEQFKITSFSHPIISFHDVIHGSEGRSAPAEHIESAENYQAVPFKEKTAEGSRGPDQTIFHGS